MANLNAQLLFLHVALAWALAAASAASSEDSCLLQARKPAPAAAAALPADEAAELRRRVASAEAKAELWRKRALDTADALAEGKDREGLDRYLQNAKAEVSDSSPDPLKGTTVTGARTISVAGPSYENSLPDIVDIPILPKELYLVPYLNELVPYKETAIGKQFVTLLWLVDIVPAWLANVFIPVVMPGGTSLTLDINEEIDTSIHVGPFSIPTPMSLWIKSAQVQNLNTLTELKPLKLDKGGSFSFSGQVGLETTRVIVYARMTILLAKMDITITVDVKNVNVGYEFILAFQRQRICEVFGQVMMQGAGCATFPIFTKESTGSLWWKQQGISGFRLEDFNLTMEDFDLNIEITGGSLIGMAARKIVQDLQDKLNADHQKVFVDIEKNKEEIIDFSNHFITHNLISLQKRKGKECVDNAIATMGLNVSRVCFNNYAGFALKWDYMECLTGEVSQTTHAFPAGNTKCVDVQSFLPYAEPGHILRTQTKPIGGLVQMPDPPLIYVPGSNSIGLYCSGSTLLYNCDVTSVVPVNPLVLPEVQTFCVYNEAGFALYTDAKDLRTGNWAGRSHTFGSSRHYCGDLGATLQVLEGDEFRVQAQAIGGKLNPMDRNILYKKNGLSVSYVCRGSTMIFDCKLIW